MVSAIFKLTAVWASSVEAPRCGVSTTLSSVSSGELFGGNLETKRREHIVGSPLYWVSLYVLCAYLFRRDWLFLVATQALVVAGAVVLATGADWVDPLVSILISVLGFFAALAGFAHSYAMLVEEADVHLATLADELSVLQFDSRHSSHWDSTQSRKSAAAGSRASRGS